MNRRGTRGNEFLRGWLRGLFRKETAMAVPTKDSELVSFSTNFSTRITATPVVFGLTAGDATAYAALHTAFLAAYNAVTTARDAGDRSKSLATAKDLAKGNLLVLA